MKTTDIFVYGSLRKGGSNHSILTSSKFIGCAKTVQKLIMRARAFPFVSDDQQVSFIHGEVYSVNSSVLRLIDQLESYDVLSPQNSWYEREKVLVKMGEGDRQSLRKVEMYFNRKENKAPIIASGDFFNLEDRNQSTEMVHYFAYGSNRNPIRLRTEKEFALLKDSGQSWKIIDLYSIKGARMEAHHTPTFKHPKVILSKVFYTKYHFLPFRDWIALKVRQNTTHESN